MPPTPPATPDPSVVSPPSYQLPPVPRVSHTRRNIGITIAVILILSAAMAGVYFFTPFGASLQNTIMPVSVPSELQSASFLSDSAAGKTIIYHFSMFGKSTEDSGSVIVSAAQSAAGTARITQAQDGTFSVLIDDKTVLHDRVPRIGIDRSPDGKAVVFAQVTSTEVDPEASSTTSFVLPGAAPMLGLSNRGWNVIEYIPATNTSLVLGVGASPFFLDATHVVWIAPAGLAVIDLSTEKSTVLVKSLTLKALSTMVVSPDHTVIGIYDGPSKKLSEYRVTPTSATALPVTAIPGYSPGVNPIHSLSLINDAVYLLRRSDTQTMILKQSFGQQPVEIAHFPVSLGIGRILIGNL